MAYTRRIFPHCDATRMIQSMTGFAAASKDLGSIALTLEIKSVNSRFLDLAFRLSDELRSCEMPMREAISARIGRGKVECRAYVQNQPGGRREQAPEPVALAQLMQLQAAIRDKMPEAAPMSVSEILRWP